MMDFEELPREKILHNNIDTLSTKDLMAVLIGFGNKKKTVFELSEEVLSLIDNLSDLKELTIEELIKIDGMGTAKATCILAAVELGKRLYQKNIDKTKITTPSAVFEHFHPICYNLTQEHLYALYVDSKGHFINKKLITIGNTNSAIVDDKEIFKWAYKYSASAIILIHNHPSGDSAPSIEDIEATKAFIKKSKTLGFILLDHIIIGNDYFSFKAHFNFF